MKHEAQPTARKYDLEERSARFGEAIIRFAKALKRDCVTRPLIGQLIRAAGSVGANYAEADNALTKKEFRHRIFICKKEAKETMHWLRMIAAAEPKAADETRRLWQEAKELHLIFAGIGHKTRPDSERKP